MNWHFISIALIFCSGANSYAKDKAFGVSFGTAWRGVVNERIATVLPTRSQIVTSQFATVKMAQIVGIAPSHSSEFNRGNVLIKIEWARRIAAYFRITPGFILAEDVVRQFASLEGLFEVIRAEHRSFQALLLDIYVGTDRSSFSNLAYQPVFSASSFDFVSAWRREVNRRLSKVLPDQGGRSASGVSADALARLIGTSQPYATGILNGPYELTFDHARLLTAEFGETPEHWLAADFIYSSFASLAGLDAAINPNDTVTFQTLLRRLYIGAAERQSTSSQCRSLLTE